MESTEQASIYDGYERTDHGILRDSELVNDSVQKMIMSEAKPGSKYTIKMNFRKKPVVGVSKKKDEQTATKATTTTKEATTKAATTKGTKGAATNEDRVTKSFEEMMARFEQMVQMNQMIQMNQMTQLQMMSHLMELKASVVETRQDLGYKLKELDHKVDVVAATSAAAASMVAYAPRGPGRPKKQPVSQAQQLIDSISAAIGETDETEDLSHLTPLHKENGHTIMKLREINEDYVKSLIKAKTMTSFVKAFDYLYKSPDKTHKDVYPIRMIKAKTFQYLNRDGQWILDTNGTTLLDIICSNIEMLMAKINNQFFEEEEFDVNDFVDNQAFIGSLDDKKVRAHLLNHIRDGVLNHSILSAK